VNIVKTPQRTLQPLPADRPVSDIMTRDVTTATPETPAQQVVELLLGKLFKAVPVVDTQRRVVGIISSGDLLRKAGMPVRLAVGVRLQADDLNNFLTRVSNDKTAGQIMTSPVVTAHEDDPLGHVVQEMIERNLKRVPVVDSDGKLTGMLSRRDVLRSVAGSDPGLAEQAPSPRPGRTIGELMLVNIPTVHLTDDLVDVLHEILQTDIQRVIVLDAQDQPVGVITDGDVVARVNPVARANVLQVLAARVLGSGIQRGSVSAQDLMSQNVLAVPKDTPVHDAISLMMREGRKRLLVVDQQGRPVGMIDRQTLMASSLGMS
jgi:CBS domain-containing protein